MRELFLLGSNNDNAGAIDRVFAVHLVESDQRGMMMMMMMMA